MRESIRPTSIKLSRKVVIVIVINVAKYFESHFGHVTRIYSLLKNREMINTSKVSKGLALTRLVALCLLNTSLPPPLLRAVIKQSYFELLFPLHRVSFFGFGP